MARGRFEILRCGVHGIDAVAADTAHAFCRHTHDQFGIGVIVRGAQRSASGRGMVEAVAGDVITVNPGEVHDGLPLDGRGRSWKMLYFDPAALVGPVEALTQGRAAASEFAYPALRDAKAAARFLALYRALTDTRGGDSEIEVPEAMLLTLARLIERRPAAPIRGVAPGIERAKARIDDDPSAPLSLDALAALADLSPFQLVRGFAKRTGLTPHTYLMQRRLHRARALIAAGAPLADAAHGAGFADQSHLTRLFGRAYGLSPGRYAAAVG